LTERFIRRGGGRVRLRFFPGYRRSWPDCRMVGGSAPGRSALCAPADPSRKSCRSPAPLHHTGRRQDTHDATLRPFHRSALMLLLNPGPVTLTERVRRSLLQPDLCHRESEFFDLQDEARTRLLRVYDLDPAE